MITNEMKEFLFQLRDKVDVGMVGGSDYSKAQEQLGGGDGESCFAPNFPTISMCMHPIFIRFTRQAEDNPSNIEILLFI
jgi:hypothetical protein